MNNDKELYQQKKQTQLNEWKTIMLHCRTQSLAARTNVQVELGKHVKLLEGKLEEGKTELAQLTKTTNSNFESAKKGFEIIWESINTAVLDTATKFKPAA